MPNGIISDEAAKLTVQGLKEAGFNFAAILPDIQHTAIQEAIQADKSFAYNTISEEGVGYAMCSGAWFGGKKPVLIITTAGLHNMCWAISAAKNYHSPVLLLIPHRGVIGDSVWFMRKYIHKIEPYLELFDMAFKVVEKVEEIKPTIKAAANSINKMLVPAVILYSGETLW